MGLMFVQVGSEGRVGYGTAVTVVHDRIIIIISSSLHKRVPQLVVFLSEISIFDILIHRSLIFLTIYTTS